MSYLKEFPDFPPETMPAIPGGFDDVSWHNDSCPSFLNEALGLIIFVDFSEKEKREFPDDDIPRFNVNPWVNGDTGERLVESDDWADILAYIVARQFSVEIKKEISPDQLRLVVTRNKTADYAGGSCATHDFCDANMSMLAAMNAITGRDTMETQTDEDLTLWNAAWSIAKAAEFWIDEPDPRTEAAAYAEADYNRRCDEEAAKPHVGSASPEDLARLALDAKEAAERKFKIRISMMLDEEWNWSFK